MTAISAMRVSVRREEPLWAKAGTGFSATLKKAAHLAVAAAPPGRRGDLTVLLAGDDTLAALNARFRGKTKPTNVLSFPGGAGDYLGDVAIAYGATAREADAAGKTLRDHGLHLAVHGVLHLLGYDHETAREARIMERQEIAILAQLGIADPYAPPAKAARAG